MALVVEMEHRTEQDTSLSSYISSVTYNLATTKGSHADMLFFNLPASLLTVRHKYHALSTVCAGTDDSPRYTSKFRRRSPLLLYPALITSAEMANTTSSFTVSRVTTVEDLSATTLLFKAYAQSLGIDLTFQDFTTEISSMPGKYAPPTGCLLIARSPTGSPVGCVGLRPLPRLSITTCEMKRLYVDPEARGLKLGTALAEAVISEARMLGYKAIVLDTLASMHAARKLYESLGFEEIEAYYETPVKDETVFLRLWL